ARRRALRARHGRTNGPSSDCQTCPSGTAASPRGPPGGPGSSRRDRGRSPSRRCYPTFPRPTLRCDHAEELAVDRDGVELAVVALAERRDLLGRVRLLDLVAVTAGCKDRPDLAAAEVGEDIVANELGFGRAAVHDSAGDRAVAARVPVFGDRQRLARAVAGRRVIAVATFHDVPAVVSPARLPVRLAIDLFPITLPDIANEQVAIGSIEREPPRVAEAGRPDLVTPAAPDVRIARGDAVRAVLAAAGTVDVDAQDLAEAV